jgi:hypothetical protein
MNFALAKMTTQELQAAFAATRDSLKKPGSKTLTATRRAYWRKVQAEIRKRVSAGQM